MLLYRHDECNLILSRITQKRFEKIKIRELLIRPTHKKKMTWPHLMFQGMYKYIRLPHIHISLARWNEYKYFIFHLIQK